MTAPNFQFSADHKLYLMVDSNVIGDPTFGRPLNVTNYADGTNTGGGSGLTDGINDKLAKLTLTKNVEDLNEDASENTETITTRADAEQGISSQVITTTDYSFNYQMLYKANDDGAADLANAFTDPVFAALLRAAYLKKEIYGIDLDGVLDAGTPENNLGRMGFGSNWTVSLGRAKNVAGVVRQTATFTSSSYGEWLVHDGVAVTGGFNRLQP